MRSRAYGESDKIVAFLSRDFGKISGIAKGALRSKRRFVATGTVAREGSSLVFRPTSVAVDGRAPPPGTRSLAEQKATLRVQLPPLPGGISAYGIAAVDGGVALSAILRDQLLDLSS